MKYLVALIFLVLLIASEETWRHMPGVHSSAPVITWVTDNNPARAEQVSLFQDWLTKVNGPPAKLMLDCGNSDDTKKIIQSVSGIGSDVMDVSPGRVGYYNAIGFLEDVTGAAKKLDYGLNRTYPSAATDIAIPDANGDEHQYLFPCNLSNLMGIVNVGALKAFNQPIPPTRWTVQEFEDRGKAFVDAANAPGKRDHFYCPPVDIPQLRNSYCVCQFNETQTRCTLNDPNYAKVLKLVQRWRAMHITPSKADEASFNGETSSYGGEAGYMFDVGKYALLWSGRYIVIQFREDNKGRASRGEPPLELAVVEPPNGGFPITSSAARSAGVYRGGQHVEAAEYFQKFLASDDYNRHIVEDGDGLPPDPKWAQTEEFLHPKEDPARGVYKATEWNFHGPFATGALEIAVGSSYSPFVLNAIVDREDNAARDLFLESNELTAEQTVRRAEERVNDEIRRTISENPTLEAQYDLLCDRQQKIDALKAAGKKVPIKWIIDPHRKAFMKAHHETDDADQSS